MEGWVEGDKGHRTFRAVGECVSPVEKLDLHSVHNSYKKEPPKPACEHYATIKVRIVGNAEYHTDWYFCPCVSLHLLPSVESIGSNWANVNWRIFICKVYHEDDRKEDCQECTFRFRCMTTSLSGEDGEE